MKTKPLAFSVHLFTGSGAALALMAMVAATQGNWRLMFGWLGIALIVDGIDGPLARKVDTKKNAANWDGTILDLVIDYLTYVFIPAYALIYSDLLPSPWGLMAALFWPMVRFYGLNPAWAALLPVAALFYCAMTIDSGIAHRRGRGGAWKGRLQGGSLENDTFS